MNVIEIEVNPPFIKLEQFLKFAGLCETGGHAKIIILDETVLVNGDICTMRGKKLRDGDLIAVKGDDHTFKVVINDN